MAAERRGISFLQAESPDRLIAILMKSVGALCVTVIMIEKVMNWRGSGGTQGELREKGYSNNVNWCLYKILKMKNK